MSKLPSPLEAAYDLFRRLPPAQLETNLSFVSEMLDDDDCDSLLQTVDAPLKINKSCPAGPFIECDYNRDGDSYRSPHDSKYYPSMKGGVQPSGKLRKMEVAANHIFNIYAQQYYGSEGSFSSVYFWDCEKGSFAACVLIHKDAAAGAAGMTAGKIQEGIWDSIHLFSVDPKKKSASYKLSTTVIISMKTDVNHLELSGSVQRQTKADGLSLSGGDLVTAHIVNMGNMVQDMENSLRSALDEIYFGKAREIHRTLRQTETSALRKNKLLMKGELAAAIANRRGKKN